MKINLRSFVRNNFTDVLFVFMYSILSLLIFVKICLNSNVINYVENRSSYRFSFPKLSEVLNNTFQDNFENAVIDQMPKNDLLKNSYNKVTTSLLFKTLEMLDLDKINEYVTFDNGMNLYKNYLLYSVQLEDSFRKNALDDIKSINNIYDSVDSNIYLYFVETDTNNKFDENYNYDTINYLKSKLDLSENNIGGYEIDRFKDDYKGNFYKTDHHWNYKGSYRGYLEIANLMDFDIVLENKDKVCFNEIKFSGSKTKTLGDSTYFYDYFCMYDFDFPEFNIKIEGKKVDDYGYNLDYEYVNNSISYADIYGSDYAEIIFKNEGNNNGKKLLVYSNSYSNAINKLLASNYRTTYVIDGRHYEDYDMIDYINNNNIDDVLILANSMLFWDDVDW